MVLLRNTRRTRWLWLSAVVLMTGCSTARVYRSYPGTAIDRTTTLVGSRIPGPITAQVLERQNVRTSFLGRVWPGQAADRLEETGAVLSDSDGLIALADLRAKQARRQELIHRQTACELYLDAIEAATAYLARTPTLAVGIEPIGPQEQEARRAYNAACAGFLRCSAGTTMQLDETWVSEQAARGVDIRLRNDPALWQASRFDHFYFASDYRVLGIQNPRQNDGLGVPLIAERRTPPFVEPETVSGEASYYPLGLQAYPATAVIRAERAAGGKRRSVTIELHDPMRTESIDFPGGMRPLAYDLTTPLAFYFTSLPLPQITQIGLLRPGVLEKQTGLYMLHPYEPGKIPVVLVHGLWSSPDTWHQALNDLRGDPSLRQRYQFWVFFYPTGDPFIYSATKLRESLAAIRQTLDPDRTDAAFDQTVLVGHSMGGILSRLMVQDSGTAFWDAIANRSFSELQAGPVQRAMLSKVFFFSTEPSIRRVVFIATPHQGSTLSGALIGRLGNALIRLPSVFEDIQRSLIDQNDPDFFKAGRLTATTTSITQLSLKSPMLTALNSNSMPPGLPYHSIIAQAAPGPVESGTDLIVSYKSSHLEGADSELIVDGNHACLNKPETIAELRRILHLHLRELTLPPPDAIAPNAGRSDHRAKN